MNLKNVQRSSRSRGQDTEEALFEQTPSSASDASAMCVAAYYMGINLKTGEEELSYDTHADCTITVNGSEDGVLAVGTNIISATTVCKDESGKALTIDDIIVTICENKDVTYTYIVSGIGYDGADYYTLDKDGAVTTTEDPDNWPANWKMYKFDGTKGGSECVFAVYSDGWFLFGTDAQAESFAGTENGATLGYWGYVDDEIVFYRISGSIYMGTATYVACTITTNADGSVTITEGSDSSAISGTITDIGCLVGEGYDLSELTIS